ncbi:MAG: sugar O-acetyltransferase [Solobacterium sp.]|nr:sugar O-acetyltransferase [Solobacterium sp.]
MISEEKLKAFKHTLNNGELYNAMEDELISYQHSLVQKLNEFNRTDDTPEGLKQRDEILKELMGTYGEGLYICPPVYANWGLRNVHVGKNVFFNFGCTFVDDADITIGDNTLFGPQVSINTAEHPISPELRRNGLQYNKPVHIGKNVWLGAGVIVLAGVAIGDNSVIGAGSVVTKDIPANCIALGTPARVIREITEQDDLVYDGNRQIPEELRERYILNAQDKTGNR